VELTTGAADGCVVDVVGLGVRVLVGVVDGLGGGPMVKCTVPEENPEPPKSPWYRTA
jgi:hypothetical protein